ncbi:MAG: family 78 glycoside hydrolase catalytic domain [Ginsengibacter sp.]
MKKFILILVSLVASLVIAKAASPLQPAILTCEYIENPLSIDIKIPRLSWTLKSIERNQFQSAYKLTVSDNIKDMRQDKGNVWSTGKIISPQNIQIEYSGIALKSFTRYYWKVKVYNQNDEASSWSDINWFETAMLDSSDWKAQWISDGSKNPVKDEDYYKDDRMPLLRKEFATNKEIISARLYICGLGYYEAYLNGRKIGDHVLDPGFTTYRKQVLYVVHDVTSLIKKGANVAGIMLGSGWWNPLPFKLFGRWDLRNYQQTGRPCVKAEIHIHYSDGEVEKVITGEGWQTAPGPIIKNNVYLGEKYDARLEQKNWNTINADKLAWKNATIVQGPSGELSVPMQPAIKISRIIKPVSITEIKPDTFIVDMGQNFAGVARIKIKGIAGTKITLRYGEGIFADGSLNVMTTAATQIKKGGIRGGPGAPETAWQEDGYILKGDGIEIWNPRFTFHGFQYIEITGWPGKPTLDDIEGLRMNADLSLNGKFACSNDTFNKLHEVIQWTFLSNVFSVQSDCPGREKMGYGADIAVTANAFIYNYNMANFYSKTVKDFANEQQPDGGITEIAPFTGIADKGYGGDSGPLGWELAFPFVQKQLYDYYDDKRIIQNNYEAFKRQLSFLQLKAVDDLFYWDISDHEAIDPKPEAFTAAAFYYHHVMLAAEFAGILGKADDSIKYAKLAQRIKNNIVQKSLVPNTGRFDNATQSAQIFSLWYNFSPEKDNSIKVLLDEFVRHKWHLSTGIFSTKMMFDVLRENDMNEVAYQVANQKDFPGWVNMLQNGATTLWESWEFPETDPSRNHPMFGSVDEWFYRSLLGINPAAPGFEKIIIKPQPAGDLSWAKGSYNSIRGLIVSDWKLNGNDFILNVSIPANTQATVYIPSKVNGKILESGKPVNVLRYEKGYAVVETGSGNYAYTSGK